MQNQLPIDGPPQTANFAEGESWFTTGQKAYTPDAASIEAQPKQPWDSYKPDFWWGILCFTQKPLWNMPYFWAGTGWSQDSPTLDMSYASALAQQVAGNARTNQLYTAGAPTSGIYTGTDEGRNP